MKKNIFTILAIIGLGLASVHAQKSIRLGYIDMEYILQNVPEYQEANKQLDNRVQEWKAEAEAKLKKVEEMRASLDNERPLLTKELIEDREEEISYMEQQARKYQQDRFGPNGDYIIQKKQLVRPIQDQVFTAVQQIAENRNLDFVFDRTSDIGMIYADKQYDVSELVLRTIQRTANREQLQGRDEIEEMEEAEARTPEQQDAIDEREQLVEERKNEREAYIEEKKRERDSIRAAKQREFEERRQKILAERERKRDSILQAREKKNDTIN
ncbi:OmpH family outer membrane protein [Gramella sp. BOM4]|nr:OmpH family outer membrane protein [Christiangramia bathymodioli]